MPNMQGRERAEKKKQEKRKAVLAKMRPISVSFMKRRTVSENPDLMKFWDEKGKYT